jgi:hypothetical protein
LKAENYQSGREIVMADEFLMDWEIVMQIGIYPCTEIFHLLMGAVACVESGAGKGPHNEKGEVHQIGMVACFISEIAQDRLLGAEDRL